MSASGNARPGATTIQCCSPKTANKWTARIIPLVLLGAFGYASWAVTQKLCIDYLIHPPEGVTKRVGSAIAILVIFYLLLFTVLVCYAKLIFTIVKNPGFIPRGPQWHAQIKNLPPSHPKRREHEGYRSGNATNPESNEKDDSSAGSVADKLENGAGSGYNPGMDFWKKDVFVCSSDGRPRWCSVCMNFKPDRAHHCREVNRCVEKMDHFCPWVGGIVSETSFKFFMQFVFYAALFTLHTLISTVYFVVRKKQETGSLDVYLVVVVALAALFFLFTSGMTLSTVQLTMAAATTVENLDKSAKVWYLAVLIPRPDLGHPSGESPNFLTITYPRPPEEQFILQKHGGYAPPEAIPSNDSHQTFQQPAASGQTSSHYVPPRTFAILATKPGENPFNLGPLSNMKEVLGYSYLDWFLPIRYSPCLDHSSNVSMFKMNGVVRRLQVEAGLVPAEENQPQRRRSHSNRRDVRHGHKHSRRRRRRSRSQDKEEKDTEEGGVLPRA